MQPLDRVGDLVFAAPRRRNRADGVVHRRVEQVHADEREVGRWFRRLLDQANDLATRVERGDAELARIVDVREQDLRGGARQVLLAERGLLVVRRFEPVDERDADPAAACCRRGT